MNKFFIVTGWAMFTYNGVERQGIVEYVGDTYLKLRSEVDGTIKSFSYDKIMGL